MCLQPHHASTPLAQSFAFICKLHFKVWPGWDREQGEGVYGAFLCISLFSTPKHSTAGIFSFSFLNAAFLYPSKANLTRLWGCTSCGSILFHGYPPQRGSQRSSRLRQRRKHRARRPCQASTAAPWNPPLLLWCGPSEPGTAAAGQHLPTESPGRLGPGGGMVGGHPSIYHPGA